MRSIISLPDKRLRQKSLPVEYFDDGLKELSLEIQAAMLAGPGGVGIAAPQIGEMSSVVLVDCRQTKRPCDNHGLLFLVNPEIISLTGGEVLGREGCLSVPEWTGMVPRARDIHLRYHGLEGQELELTSSGFEARVIQHEIDHLYGVLFIDRMISTHDLVRRAR